MTENINHPVDSLLLTEVIPSVWCPGCGIGTVVNTFLETLEKLKIDLDKISVASGVGCTAKVVDYLKLNSIPVVDGNAIYSAIMSKTYPPLAEKFKFENPGVKVVTFLNDADFVAFGIDGLIEAGRKDTELLVIHINNFIYIVTEYKVIPTTPFIRTSVNKSLGLPFVELPFNIPHLAKSSGARYVARWTPLHVRRLMYSITDALNKPGFSVIEVISPCLMYYATEKKLGETIDRMRFFHDNTVIKHGEPTENLDIRHQDKIIVGKFVDK